jgi:hypothetical protein
MNVGKNKLMYLFGVHTYVHTYVQSLSHFFPLLQFANDLQVQNVPSHRNLTLEVESNHGNYKKIEFKCPLNIVP